jgi:hypothetical protein
LKTKNFGKEVPFKYYKCEVFSEYNNNNKKKKRLKIQRPLFRFPALPDFLRNSGSGTGSTQPREDN